MQNQDIEIVLYDYFRNKKTAVDQLKFFDLWLFDIPSVQNQFKTLLKRYYKSLKKKSPKKSRESNLVPVFPECNLYTLEEPPFLIKDGSDYCDVMNRLRWKYEFILDGKAKFFTKEEAVERRKVKVARQQKGLL